MRKNTPSPSRASRVKTFYGSPRFLNRLLGRYTVEWDVEERQERLVACTRVTDFEGNCPSPKSIFALPFIIKTYFSIRRRHILSDPIPFLVMDAIAFLDRIVRPGMKVLELGAGNSTLWFLGKGVELISVEHSRNWAQHILDHIRKNACPGAFKRFQLEIKEGKDTITFINKLADDSLDLVLVDCANDYTSRNECVLAARQKIVKGGWMALDNSDHPVNWVGVDSMTDSERFRFTGYSPMSLNVSQTSFWRIR
jgi:hypothetical protein